MNLIIHKLSRFVLGALSNTNTHTILFRALSSSFPFPPFFPSLLCRFPDCLLQHTHIHNLTHTHSSVSTSPGAPGKGRAKMEMNSAMLQVATQICICNYPQKYTGSFLSLSSSCLLPSLSSLFPISSFSPRLYLFPFSVCISELPPFSSSMSISHSLCLKGFLSDAWWAN